MLESKIPPIKEEIPKIKVDKNIHDNISPNITQSNDGLSVLVIVLSCISIVLTPILSRFWIFLIIPIALAIVSLIFSLKEFKVCKEWIIALVLSIMALVNVALTIEQMIINNIMNYRSYYEPYQEVVPWDFDDDYYWYE